MGMEVDERRFDSLVDDVEFKALLMSEGGGDDWHVSRGEFPWNGSVWEHKGCSFSNNKVMDALIRLLSFTPECDCILIQIWVPVNNGGTSYLTTSHLPFGVKKLTSGLCSFRKRCMGYRDCSLVGGLGRAYTNGYPETSPDLRYYSNKEHPFRDEAVGCGFRGYAAFPIFQPRYSDKLEYEFVCMMELYSHSNKNHYIAAAEMSIQDVGLLIYNHGLFPDIERDNFCSGVEHEVEDLFKSAMDAVPELHLVQVHFTVNGIFNPSLICMQRKAFSVVDEVGINKCSDNHTMQEFIHASGSYIIQSDDMVLLPSTKISCLFCRNLSEWSINIYPLAHYARHARLSFYFAICLLNTKREDKPCIFEFFLHLKRREDESLSSTLKLILQVMESKLKSFKTPSGLQSLGSERVVEFTTEDNKSIAFEFNTPTISYPTDETAQVEVEQKLEFNYTWRMVRGTTNAPKFLENFLMEIVIPEETPARTSLLFAPEENVRSSKHLLDGNSLRSPIRPIQEEIKFLLKNMISKLVWLSQCLVQFWAPKEIENKLCLVTLEQTFSLGNLLKELFEFRMLCVDHRYFINDEATEEDLGPPGRVFRNCFPEYTPDLRLYSSKEFPLQDFAVRFGLRMYLALPVLSFNQESGNQCVGVLEFIGCKQLTSLPWMFESRTTITKSLEEANLKLPHSNVNHVWDEYVNAAHSGLREVTEALNHEMELGIPHLIHVEVWIPCKQCNDNKCMQLVQGQDFKSLDILLNYGRENKGRGIVGILLSSKSKACFCANLCELSIIEEPRVHVIHRERLTVCFAICLNGSYTGSMPYVLQFFLDQGCKKRENLCLFLSSLLSLMKEKLKSFSVPSEDQTRKELVIEVITFGMALELDSFCPCELGGIPVRFIPCKQQSEAHRRILQARRDAFDDELHSCKDVLEREENGTNSLDCGDVVEGEQTNNLVCMDLNSSRDVVEHEPNGATCMELNGSRDGMEGDQINPICVDLGEEVAIVSNEYGSKGNRKLFNITYEQLKPHFGNPLADVAKKFGISKSTLKRALKRLGIIDRWPSHPKNKNNPALFMASTPSDTVGTSKRQCIADNRDKNTLLSNGALHLHQQLIQDVNTRESNQNEVELTNDEFVMVKATFGKDTTKFKLGCHSKMEELNQEMASVFSIEDGSFKLKYLDTDDQWILLKRDQDLDLCINEMKEASKTIQILVETIL